MGKQAFPLHSVCGRFEPDLLENEALYMAAWLISNKPEWAENVSRETQPRASSEKMLAFFHLTPDGCRPAAEGDRPNQSARVSRDRPNMPARVSCDRPNQSARVSCDRPNMPAGDSFEPFSREEGCPFFDPDSPRHCTIYNGRASICRLCGASGSRDKFGNEVWKPCKFYPAELLEKHNPPLAHRQYSAEEIRKAFGTFPPVMSDLMEQEETFTPDDDQTRLIRDVLPERIRHLMWIMELSSGKDIH